eukprot:SAG11_NODE_10212_length_846_cov_5.165997_2_plen_34_part_01
MIRFSYINYLVGLGLVGININALGDLFDARYQAA